MKREPFITQRKERWVELEQLVGELRKPLRARDVAGVEHLPSAYRRVCQDLALAQRRMYGRELSQRLNQLALDGREQLYREPNRTLRQIVDFFARDFPRLVREEARLFWLCALLYVVPLFAWMALGSLRPDLLYAVLDADTLAQMEKSYDPDGKLARGGRDAGSDALMFGFYIRNNVSIDFQTFAGGLLGGVGTILVLIFNGIFHGAVVGHLINVGYDGTFWPFAIGHGSFELTAMVISGVAGMRLGLALLAPGRMTRGAAMRAAAPRALRILLGAAVMTTIAAFIEGFWSPSDLPTTVKYVVGAGLWALVTAYFLLAGRAHAA